MTTAAGASSLANARSTYVATSEHAFPDGPRSLEGFLKGFRLTVWVYIPVSLLLLAESALTLYIISIGGLGPDMLALYQSAIWASLGLNILVLVVGAYFVVRFTYRASRNLYTIAPRAQTHHPVWAVGAYFVPFANLVVPSSAMSEIYHGTHKAVDEKSARHSSIPLWWGAWLLSGIITNVSSRIPGFNTLTLGLDAGSCALGIVSALMLLKIMNRIETRQALLKHGAAVDVFS